MVYGESSGLWKKDYEGLSFCFQQNLNLLIGKASAMSQPGLLNAS